MRGLSSWFSTYRLLPLVLAFICGALLGTSESFAGKSKDESASAIEEEAGSMAESEAPPATGRMGKTVFVDISVFGKKDRAAKRMTKLHEKYAEDGWTVVNVAVYTENGDLEGFFVTYVKE